MKGTNERFLKKVQSQLVTFLGKDWWQQKSLPRLAGVSEEAWNAAIRKVEALVSDEFEKMTEKREVRKGGGGILRRSTENLGKGEVLLEKLITVSTDHVCNQLNIMSGIVDKGHNFKVKRMNIDLIVSDDRDTIKEMIELKDSTNDENPVSAMFQLLSYYLFFIKTQKYATGNKLRYPAMKRGMKLTVLAPKKYYKNSLKLDRRFLENVADLFRTNLKKITGRKIFTSFKQLKISDHQLRQLLASFERNLKRLKGVFCERCDA